MGRLFFSDKGKGRKNEMAAFVEINRIMPNRDQPRKNFDALQIQKLADSIRTYGVIQPLAVRISAEGSRNADSPYILIAGERRLRAAKLAGLERVPCVILDVNDECSGEMALIENLHRQDLGIFEQAEAISGLIEQYGLTQGEVAEKLGMTQPTVANKLRLLKLTPEERQVVGEYRLTERHARAVLRLPDALRLPVLTEIAEGGMNVVQAEAFVERALDELHSPASAAPEDDSEVKASAKPVGKKHKKLIIKDIRIFLNTIDSAVSVIKKSGFNAVSERKEFEDHYELKISVPKEG